MYSTNMRDTLESEARNTREKKRGERFTLHPNPLRLLRLEFGYTQKEVSDHLGITRQVILDNELGLSMHPNPKYVAYLAQYDATQRTLISDAWYAWRRQRRADPDDPEGPGTLVEALSSLVQPPTTLSGVITLCPPHSVRGFARMFILQTSIVNSYLNSGHHWQQIKLALEDANFSPTVIELLHRLPRTQEQLELITTHATQVGLSQ